MYICATFRNRTSRTTSPIPTHRRFNRINKILHDAEKNINSILQEIFINKICSITWRNPSDKNLANIRYRQPSLMCQKRPTTVSKETCCSWNRQELGKY